MDQESTDDQIDAAVTTGFSSPRVAYGIDALRSAICLADIIHDSAAPAVDVAVQQIALAETDTITLTGFSPDEGIESGHFSTLLS